MSKKRKITIQELPDYYDYRRFRNKDGSVSGYRYYLCCRLSNDESTRLLTEYHNTELAKLRLEFASEISKDVLIVYDKCIR